MKALKRVLYITLIACGIFFVSTSAAIIQTSSADSGTSNIIEAEQSPPLKKDQVVPDGNGGSEVENPGLLSVFGPATTLIGALAGGLLLVIKAINEGKGIDVKASNARADAAEAKSASEIAKIQVKLESMEAKLDLLMAEREEERIEHHSEMTKLNDRLIAELRNRFVLEELLATNGIIFDGI